jgi:uncharacterized protein (DUF1778 family)
MLNQWKTYPLRLTIDDHTKMVEAAKKEGLTLEKFILQAISEKIESQKAG